jgi:hypothetical protein
MMRIMLRTTLYTITITTLLLTGCKKKDDKAAPAGESAGGGAPAVEPFKGELTEAVLDKATHAIKVYKPDGQPTDFAPTLATAKTALGEPTHVDGSSYAWGFVNGDKCTYYVLEDKGGKASSPGTATVDKMAGAMYETCMKAIGKAASADGSAAAGSGSAAADGSAAAGSAKP